MNNTTDNDFYPTLINQVRSLLTGEPDAIANAANLSALLYQHLPDINWVGFYFMRGDELVVGPYQGKPACTRIALGKGVCGVAMQTRQTQRVADVHAIDNHIACDVESRSEIVVPLFRDDRNIGVLDIDSPTTGRFGPADQQAIEAIAAIYLATLD